MPLINIPSADIRIRPELVALLPHANIESSHLITLDDLPLEEVRPDLTNWTLVDHNALQGQLGQLYARRVSGCIDHHVDEQQVPTNVEEEPRVVTKTGSCTSLVVNQYRDVWDRLSDSSSSSNTAQGQSDAVVGSDDEAVRRTWDMQLAKLALASILIDTRDLTSTDKVTEHDRRAVQYLENKIVLAPRQGALFDRHAFFQQINDAKGSLESLSLQDILRKDYKQWEENGKQLGVSSSVKPLSFLSRKAGQGVLEAELYAFAIERNLAAFAVMTTFTSEAGEFQRELLLKVMSVKVAEMLQKFESAASSDLKLESSDDVAAMGFGTSTKIWWQRDTSKSRKQVAPMMREVLRGMT